MPKYKVHLQSRCRPDVFAQEGSDCTVHAIRFSSGCGYELAHEIMRAAGRKERKGGHIWKAVAPALERGIVIEQVKIYYDHRKNITNTVKAYNRGRYIFVTSRHAFAVVNGVIQDTFKPARNCMVRGVFRVEHCPAALRGAKDVDSQLPAVQSSPLQTPSSGQAGEM